MYEKLSQNTENRLKSENPDFAFKDENAIRRVKNPHDEADALRSNFIKDVDKILNCPYFSRYSDKTQVFSFYKNDDISRRATHVQFVSRIARTIGKALRLNLELIEAIAIGHDIGHTPFGHTGESALDKIYFSHTGRHFLHNLHSVRVLEDVFPLNLTLQTLDGILCHNGETELKEYRPVPLTDFNSFDIRKDNCYNVKGFDRLLTPSTLEACVVRISDIIAYLGKDRQDAIKTGVVSDEDFSDNAIGNFNAEIINNLTVNLVENSFGKDYLSLDDKHFDGLKKAKKENGDKIYFNEKVKTGLEKKLLPAMSAVYDKLLFDLKEKNKKSPVFTHHIDYVNSFFYKRQVPYENTEQNLIAVDYIASMTDDYFTELYRSLFPDGDFSANYKDYFG